MHKEILVIHLLRDAYCGYGIYGNRLQWQAGQRKCGQ